MTVTISGTNGIDKVAAGSVESGDIAVGAVSQTNLAAGVVGNGPAFNAYLPTNQTITTSTATKIQLSTETFDTNSNYDTSTYRFTPTVAGYYQVNGALYPQSTVSGSYVAIYKNGSALTNSYGPGSSVSCHTSTVVYLNGSTDYIELYAYLVGTTPVIYGRTDLTYMSAVLVRAA